MSQLTNRNTVSIKFILNKLLRDEPYIPELNLGDAIEWAGECINLLGINSLYVSDICKIDIKDYRGVFPSNFKKLEAIREVDTNIALSETTRKFPKGQSSDSIAINELDFDIKENVIFTGFEKGTIECKILKYNLDEEGFPLIPDEERTINCIYWYIAQKVAWKQFAIGNMPQGIYDRIDQQASWYMGSARYKGKTPNKQKMQSIMDQQMQIVPNQFLYRHSFVNLENIENIKLNDKEA